MHVLAEPRQARDLELPARLATIVGSRNVKTGDRATGPYRRGFRCGDGPVLAVVLPGSLVEQWRVLKECVLAGVIVIAQAANTGLTGGSSPHGTYDRDVVVINLMRIKGLHIIADGEQVVCLPGTTLTELEQDLRPLGREPHSVIGSSCIGASVFGGVCNNSGGALVRRGPAYTQLSLHAQIDRDGCLQLVNHLGIALPTDPELALAQVEQGRFSPEDVSYPLDRVASDNRYSHHVRQIEEPTPARYNADPSRLYEASGCAGKLMVFALRLDTFPSDGKTTVFYIGSNDPNELTAMRRAILADFQDLPVACEYMHRDARTIAERYGKDMFLAIKWMGASRIPLFFKAKAWIDSAVEYVGLLPRSTSDLLLQFCARLLPRHLPSRLRDFHSRFEHHLILKVSEAGNEEARAFLHGAFPSRSGDFFECTAAEGTDAFLHRFVAAGAAVRYRAIHHRDVEGIVAFDIALRRNDRNWLEALPKPLSTMMITKLYYGHFLCHVFHQDYIIKKGCDVSAIEEQLCSLLDARGAEYPAEHNVGHSYAAKPALVAHYAALDPLNTFNPGIGLTCRDRVRASASTLPN